MKQNIKIAKKLIKLAKDLIEEKDIKQAKINEQLIQKVNEEVEDWKF